MHKDRMVFRDFVALAVGVLILNLILLFGGII